MNPIQSIKNLSRFEKCLWCVSAVVVILSGLAGQSAWFQVVASVIGVTALIFVARGDVTGQILTIVFSVMYGIISFQFTYYGEMLTYLCMTAPIAVSAVVTWLRYPFEKGKQEVEVNTLKRGEIALVAVMTIAVTVAFYFILSYFNTANIVPSTISVATSFLASYHTFRRSRFYAMWYAANDVVLIVLWVLAAMKDIKYLPMIVCFTMFLVNDGYGFINWSRMQKRQAGKKMCLSGIKNKNSKF